VGRRYLLMLLALAAIWGSSFMFIKVAVRELEPATLVFFRLVFAVVTLAVVLPSQMPVATALSIVKEHVRVLSVTAVLATALRFWLLSWGETRIDSGLAAVLQASAPLFTALVAYHYFRSERVGGLRLLGVVIGFAGVALLVGVTPEGSVLAALAVVGTGCSYGVSALYSGKHLGEIPPIVTALATSGLAALMMAPAGLAQLPSSLPGWKTVGSVAALGIVGLGLAYILYFAIIAGAGASRAILVTYLVPAMALFYGATILAEPVKASALGGLALILGGVALGTGTVLRRRGAAGEGVVP
jgi:drug/metabolite transporter (DMT)-like permease